MSYQECNEDGCEKDRHETFRGIRANLCTEHFLEKMSSLRPDGEFEPVEQ